MQQSLEHHGRIINHQQMLHLTASHEFGVIRLTQDTTKTQRTLNSKVSAMSWPYNSKWRKKAYQQTSLNTQQTIASLPVIVNFSY